MAERFDRRIRRMEDDVAVLERLLVNPEES
jgi:hypothetical protein